MLWLAARGSKIAKMGPSRFGFAASTLLGVAILGCDDAAPGDGSASGGVGGGAAVGGGSGSGGATGGTAGDGGVGGSSGAGGSGAASGDGGSGDGGSGDGGRGGAGGDGAGGDGASGGLGGGGAGGTGGIGGTGGSGGGDIPGGGTVLFREPFEDTDFSSRGWYDGPSGTLSTSEHIPGSSSSFECAFAPGATSCSGGKPARHKFSPSQAVYLAFHIKFSDNWVGSGKAYHPHMFHFINDLDDDYVGPAHTYLTTYTEVVEGRAFLGLQDSKNVDLACLLRNDDSFEGCNGDFDSYPFTEQRSVCACNGLLGDLDGRDCFPNGDGTYYSSRSWRSSGPAFTDTPGPRYKADWHFVEAYFEMNSIEGGKGVPNGKIRWVQDGEVLVSSDRILLRTAEHETLRFTQFAMLPYIGDGSPVDQRFYVDELVVATARP